MIALNEVLAIHDILIERFGGARGVRDHAGQELYPHTVDKAAAIFESIISNHPFVDGNKRTAYVPMRLLLRVGTLEIRATADEKFDFVIKAAQGLLKFDDIKAWINSRLV